MLTAVIDWSLRHRFAVVVAWAGIAVLGLLALLELPFDAFPDTTPVLVQVNTAAPALPPLEVERRITAPVEQALSGLPGLREVRSMSRYGLSQVTLIFGDDTGTWLARQVVAERLALVELPEGAGRPALGPVSSGLGEVFHYVVRGEGKPLAEVRSAQDWILRPQLLTVPGVAEVNSWGGEARQIHVVTDPARLAEAGLSLTGFVEAIERNNRSAGGGAIERAGEAALVRGVGTAAGPEDVGAIVVAARKGVPLRVRDVARVEEGAEVRHGAMTWGGRGEAVLGLGFMLPGENSRDVTRALQGRLAGIRKSLPAGITAEVAYERTALVDRVLRTVRANLFEGALLVVAVLFVFLGNLRAGLLVALAIPLSMLFAFQGMLRAGIAGSLMSLGAIDFGLIVDSAVIQVENAMRRLGEDAGGRTRTEIVREAVLEVRRPTLFGELIIMVVYVPVLALEGIEGKLFRPMALTVLFALAGSMLLSLTLVPALTGLLPMGRGAREPWLVRLLERAYAPVLRAALRFRVPVLLGAGAVLAGALLLAGRLGAEFVPRLREGTIVVNTVHLSGISIGEAVRYGTRIEAELLRAFPDEIERVWTRTGSPEVATDPMGIELSDIFVTLRPRADWRRARTQEELVAEMEKTLAPLPGMRMIFTQPIEMRVNEMLAGIRADVGVKVFGDDYAVLEERAAEVRKVLESIPGAVDVTIEQVTGQPEIVVEADREACGRHGIAVDDVLLAVEALAGIPAGEIQEGARRFPIAVRISPEYRSSAEALARVPVTDAAGSRVPLGSLARIRLGEGPANVQREGGKRRVVVQANVRGRDPGSFVEEARAALDARVPLPPGYALRFGGQFENYERARARLLVVVPVALLLIFTLLYFTYGRALDAARVFTGVPFAAVGGVLALWLRGMPFSIPAGVGFVALSGVAVLGDMVLVSTVRRNLREGMALPEAVGAAAARRLRAVLMTALVASLGFLPMALNTGIGAEVQKPLATVVIGGVLSSTLLTLVVLPALYLVLGDRPRRP